MKNQNYYKNQFNKKIENRFYVYVHYKLSDGKPFYVGKGTSTRAWNKSSRSEYWKRVVNKHGLAVEIIFDDLTEDESLAVEKDTILEFKYFNYDLVNFSSGGEGISGYKFTQAQKEKLSSSHKGKKLSEDHKNKLSQSIRMANIDDNIYTFANFNYEIFIGTRDEFLSAFSVSKMNIYRILKNGFCKNWVLVKDLNLVKECVDYYKNNNRGSRSKIIDKTIYSFVNIKTCEVFVGTRMQLVENFNVDRLNLSQLLRKNKPVMITDGWCLLLEEESSQEAIQRISNIKKAKNIDKTVYTFVHKSGDVFIGTRNELCEKYKLNCVVIGSLFTKRKRNTAKGWSLLKD